MYLACILMYPACILEGSRGSRPSSSVKRAVGKTLGMRALRLATTVELALASLLWSGARQARKAMGVKYTNSLKCNRTCKIHLRYKIRIHSEDNNLDTCILQIHAGYMYNQDTCGINHDTIGLSLIHISEPTRPY